jgi:hypothetical protein
MKTVGSYDTPFEAEVARGLLESEGIAAFVQNENTGNVMPFASAIASLRPYVVVDDDDLERAVEVLGQREKRAEGVVRCPDCGSEQADFRFFSRDRPIWRFVSIPLFIFVLLAGGCPGNIRRGWHCRGCGNWF